MPLIKGYSNKAIGKNIAAEAKAGRPKKVAVAIALGTARSAAKKSKSKVAKAILKKLKKPPSRGSR